MVRMTSGLMAVSRVAFGAQAAPPRAIFDRPSCCHKATSGTRYVHQSDRSSMDDLGKLFLFRDVIELGGFSAAARKWDLSHSTISKHLKSLEAQLQTKLLERT